MPTYHSFEALKAAEAEGVDFRIRFRCGPSGIAVMAVHGGGIEPGTTEIAEAVAGDTHTFYTFSGLKKEGNFKLHVTSRKFDEPAAIRIAGSAQVIVTIHGCRDEKPVVYVGGRDQLLRDRFRERLSGAGFFARQTDRFPGVNPKNICNRNRRGQGVQLEISLGLRQMLFENLSRLHRKRPTPMFDTFVQTLRRTLSSV